jgi:hypothetical protein
MFFVKSFKGFRPFEYAQTGDLNEPTPSDTGWPVNTSRARGSGKTFPFQKLDLVEPARAGRAKSPKRLCLQQE